MTAISASAQSTPASDPSPKLQLERVLAHRGAIACLVARLVWIIGKVCESAMQLAVRISFRPLRRINLCCSFGWPG